jgi:hypothetical protein
VDCGAIHQYAGDKVSLHHNQPNYSGRWEPAWVGDQLYWRCERCLGIGHHSDATARAALQENKLGMALQQLADAGEWLILDAEEDLGW